MLSAGFFLFSTFPLFLFPAAGGSLPGGPALLKTAAGIPQIPATGQQPASPLPVILFAVCGCLLVAAVIALAVTRRKRSGNHFKGK